jgi:hypothetical protein
MISRAFLAALQGATSQLERNKHLWTYTIDSFRGSPYLTRTLFPRIPLLDRRMMLHRIHRPDEDSEMHDHPWKNARFLILSGGYTEVRLVEDEPTEFTYGEGDVNVLDWTTYHRIVDLKPNTWTLGLIGERVQDWGFLCDGEKVPWQEFFRRKGHRPKAEGNLS